MKKVNHNMKKAGVENIFIFMILFSSFVGIFFFVINYATIIRAKDNIDALADYASNYVATRGVGDDISDTMNSIAPSGMDPINADTSALCNSIADNTHQVIFTVTSTNDSYSFYDGEISSRRVVFNQINSNTVTCNLEVTLQEN